MSQRIYTEVLRDNLKGLGYFADELYEAKSEFEFFRILAIYIVPLIRRSLAFEQIYFQWIKQKDAYLKTQKEHQEKAPQEVESAYQSLKIILEARNHLENETIEQLLESVGEVFENKHRYGMPSYVQAAYEKISALLSYLLDLGMEEIVKEYAVLKYEDRQLEFVGIKKVHIVHFKFAPSLIKLHELERMFSGSEIQDSWVAWEFLALVEWCWNTQFSFFDDKRENYTNYQSRNESVHLLGLHSHWLELNKIKQRDNDGYDVLFFTRDRFTWYVKLILNEVILYQETDVRQLSVDPKSNSSDVSYACPFVIKLRMEFTTMLLDVYWAKEGNVWIYFIAEFRDDSGRHKFFSEALKNPGKIIDVDKVSGVNCGTIAKFLDDANLNNILGTLFFGKVENQKTRKACLKSEEISCGELSKVDQIELSRHIKTLREFAPRRP